MGLILTLFLGAKKRPHGWGLLVIRKELHRAILLFPLFGFLLFLLCRGLPCHWFFTSRWIDVCLNLLRFNPFYKGVAKELSFNGFLKFSFVNFKKLLNKLARNIFNFYHISEPKFSARRKRGVINLI
jgi:hypothetical protein